MHKILLLSLIALAFSCSLSSRQSDKDRLVQKLDSLQAAVAELKSSLDSAGQNPQKETTGPEANSSPEKEVEESTAAQPSKVTIRNPAKPIPTVPLTHTLTNAATEHYYLSQPKRISAKISAWDETGKRKGTLFSHTGNETYTWEDVRLSYSSVSDIVSFHPNGAVSKMEVSFNPGASMYWYESEITFDTDNQPLWKVERQHPARSVNDAMGESFYWSDGRWVRQETIMEQPVPGK